MTVDSNIVIAYLNGDRVVIDYLTAWLARKGQLFLSAVVETEVLSYSNWTPRELYHTESFLEENFTPVAYDRAIARIAAEIRRELKIKLPDAAIAATALYTHTPILTRDVKDFRRIQNLMVMDI